VALCCSSFYLCSASFCFSSFSLHCSSFDFQASSSCIISACAWKALLACKLNASHVLHLQSYYPSYSHLVEELIVDEAFPITSILSMKPSSGRSATTVETKLGLYYKCFHR